MKIIVINFLYFNNNTMETINTIEQQKNTKLYTTGWVGFATYLGGPLAGAYLMSKNFESLNKKDCAQNALKNGIIATLLLFGLLAFIPESIMDQVPNSLIPLTYTSVIWSLMTKYQDKEIKEHLKNNGVKQSGWKVTGIAILSLIISLVYCIALIMLLPESILE